jgi:hypothetical protein
MVKISYITITARENFPTEGQPELHLWEPTLQTLKNQTFKDFEYIIIDVFYDKRPNYFKEHNYGLKIKHIPAAPNIWYKYGVVQTCEQFNKGIVAADGELLFFDADSAMLHPKLMQNLWNHYQDGYFVSLGFGADLTYSKELYEIQLDQYGIYKNSPGKWQGVDIKQTRKEEMDWYSALGYKGNVIMDHRYRQLFENTSKDMQIILPQWYYGISTASLEAVLDINGFETMFDGDAAANDIDFGNRLYMAGYKKIAMFRDSYIIEAYAKIAWHKEMRAIRPEIKCNYGLLLYNKFKGKYVANTPLKESDIEYIINDICKTKCEVRDTCKTMPHRGPFYNKNETELYDYWKKHGLIYGSSLISERIERKKEGTWVNV